MKKNPRCRCGKPCAYYGLIGGYSVACVDCNAKNAARQRERRGLISATIPPEKLTARVRAAKDHRELLRQTNEEPMPGHCCLCDDYWRLVKQKVRDHVMIPALLMLLLASPAFAQDFWERAGQDVSRILEAYSDGYRRSAREDRDNQLRQLRSDVDDLYWQNQQIIQNQQNQESRERLGW